MAADSLQKYQLEILDLENNAEVAGELGPLQYLSGLTGISMDKIINYLLLVIIFVFDPLAISLVIAANFAFANSFPKREEETPIPDIFKDEEFEDWDEEVIEDIKVNEPEIVEEKKDFLSKIDEIESRMVKDNTIEEQSQKIISLETELNQANEEINELDRAALKIVDSLKHMDDYLKHHGPYYAAQNINWSDLKLGFAEESDYIEQRKPRSKPTGKNDPYLDKNKDPDYPKKNEDDIITY